ncbi:MAG: hypothetical protein GXY58_17435 [Planctomycetaceae bacterium]|nr:hypothetical protein [Planctomycetaceae bacterium]
MNTADQAYTKAYAKHAPVACGESKSTTAGRQSQPPDRGVASAALVLPSAESRGLRYRIDRPTSRVAGQSTAHIIMPAVEQVQSYQPQDLGTSPSVQVVVEDRLQALAEALQANRQTLPPAPAAAEEDPVVAAIKPLVLMAVPQAYRPDLQSEQVSCLECLDLEPGVPGAPAAEMRLVADESAAPASGLDQDLAAIMTRASAVDAVVLPGGESAAVPPAPGLTSAEAAALLGSAEPTVPERFTPAWEVDAFRWPSLCKRLDEASGRKLTQSGAELYMAVQDGLKIIAITSFGRQEGRTTLALSLARSAATAGCRVALLDADAANPQLASQMGLDAPCDWLQVVRSGQPLCEAAVASLEDRVTLFPLSGPDPSLSGRWDDPALTTVLQKLQHAFDLIVLDTLPVAARVPSPAPVSGACQVDMALVVRDIRTTAEVTCLAAVTRVRSMGVRAVGIVENFALAVPAGP